MKTTQVTKKWVQEYFGISIPAKRYTSFWATDIKTEMYPQEYTLLYEGQTQKIWGKRKWRQP